MIRCNGTRTTQASHPRSKCGKQSGCSSPVRPIAGRRVRRVGCTTRGCKQTPDQRQEGLRGGYADPGESRVGQLRFFQTAFCTNPDRRQRVQTLILLAAPFIRARTVRRFGRNTRLVRLLAWLTVFPTNRCFPHTSHEKAMRYSLRNLFDGFTLILALVSQVVLYTQVEGKKRIPRWPHIFDECIC